MGRGRAAALVAALVLGSCAAAQAGGASCQARIAVLDFPEGNELARVAASSGGGFDLTFRHSVTRRIVRDRYVLEGSRIVQTEEEFDDHGPGLPAQAEPGTIWTRRDGVFAVKMRREIPRLIVRADGEYANTLYGAASLDLTQWGRRAVEIAAVPCDPVNR